MKLFVLKIFGQSNSVQTNYHCERKWFCDIEQCFKPFNYEQTIHLKPV